MAIKKVRCVDCGFLCLLPPKDLRPQFLNSKEDFYSECTQYGRKAIIQGTHTSPTLFYCRRGQWRMDFPKKLSRHQIFDFLKQERECLYFVEYQPGYTPDEHRDLQREKTNQRVLIRASLLGAAIGASAAIIAQLIWALYSS